MSANNSARSNTRVYVSVMYLFCMTSIFLTVCVRMCSFQFKLDHSQAAALLIPENLPPKCSTTFWNTRSWIFLFFLVTTACMWHDIFTMLFCQVILTTNLAAVVCVCVCVCVRKIWPISALTLLFRIHTSRKFCSHSKIPIRCLWTAFCVPLSLIFYDKRWFRIQIVTVRRSRFAALWQIINSRNPFSRRGWMARGQRIT